MGGAPTQKGTIGFDPQPTVDSIAAQGAACRTCLQHFGQERVAVWHNTALPVTETILGRPTATIGLPQPPQLRLVKNASTKFFIRDQGSLHYTPEHCLDNGGVGKAMF